jgi:antitoxin component YwqK of YwqJK toxin-antitoxin module
MRTLSAIMVLVLVATIPTYSQMPKHVDTLDYYIFSHMSYLEDSCEIDGKIYSPEICDRISATSSNYDHLDIDNFSAKDMRFTRYRWPNGTIEHTQYEIDPDLAPFGEYINYYPSGQVRSKWYFQEPNALFNNNGIMEGAWLYFNTDGDTLGVKRFKDGLAHGKWTILLNDSSWVQKEFENGFSEGLWTVQGGKTSRPYAYHNGFYHSTYICDENFETQLDMDEHIFQKEGVLEVDSIEYAEKGRYIMNGKFYVVRDGIRIGLKEFKNGELVQNVKFDYR